MKASTSNAGGPFFYLGLLLIAIVLISAWFGVSYYYQTLHSSGTNSNYLAINVLVNYESYKGRASQWYNETRISAGWNFYNLTFFLANGNVEAPYSSYLNAHYVTAINGVANNDTSSSFWLLWIYCPKEQAWAPSDWGADFLHLTKEGIQVTLSYGSILIPTNTLAWDYQTIHSTDPSTWQPPISGANKIAKCW